MKNESEQNKNELKASDSKTYWLKTEEQMKNERRTAENLHEIAHGNISEALQKQLDLDFRPFSLLFAKNY